MRIFFFTFSLFCSAIFFKLPTSSKFAFFFSSSIFFCFPFNIFSSQCPCFSYYSFERLAGSLLKRRSWKIKQPPCLTVYALIREFADALFLVRCIFASSKNLGKNLKTIQKENNNREMAGTRGIHRNRSFFKAGFLLTPNHGTHSNGTWKGGRQHASFLFFLFSFVFFFGFRRQTIGTAERII